MTENDLLVAKLFLDDLSCKSKCNEVETLKVVLVDIQQYRAIGTVEQCRTAVERMKESEDDGK